MIVRTTACTGCPYAWPIVRLVDTHTHTHTHTLLHGKYTQAVSAHVPMELLVEQVESTQSITKLQQIFTRVGGASPSMLCITKHAEHRQAYRA